MNSFRSGLILIAGLMLLAASLIASSLSVNSQWGANLLLLVGLLLSGFALFSLRDDIAQLFRENRRELLLTTVGLIGVLVAVAWVAALHPVRMDLTANREYSLSPQTVKMMQSIDKPVHITFFHDRGMR